MHLNIKNLLPKTDELRCIARLSNTVDIGISESKLDKYTTDSELLTDNSDLLCCDRNRNSAGVACYITHDLSYTPKNLFPNDINNVFFGTPLPKTKPITVGIIYRPPDQKKLIRLIFKIFSIFLYLKDNLNDVLSLY